MASTIDDRGQLVYILSVIEIDLAKLIHHSAHIMRWWSGDGNANRCCPLQRRQQIPKTLGAFKPSRYYLSKL